MRYKSGDTINNVYRIETDLGQTEQAEVYHATYLRLNAPCSLKIVFASGLESHIYNSYFTRFTIESKIGDLIKHPNLLRIFDSIRKEDMLILVMEYVPGGSLQDEIDRSKSENTPFAINDVLQIIHDASEGIGAVHMLETVHRDLKPANILFDCDGRAKVADLGYAQISNEANLRSELTSKKREKERRISLNLEITPGDGLDDKREILPHPGTPAYMSPEQRNTVEALSPASDVYSLGVIAFELLTGLQYQEAGEVVQTTSFREDVPQWFKDLIEQMLKEDAQDRPQSGSEVAALIRDGVRLQADEALLAAFKPSETQKQKITVFGNTMLIALSGAVTLTMTRVPPGEFIMGSNKLKDLEATDNEQPQHHVFLENFWMAKRLINNAQYNAFIKSTGYEPPPHWVNGNIPRGKERHPVVNVSWTDAMAFCKWASDLSELPLRLPTEAEWEKASRGTDGRIWPWGNNPPDEKLCNFDMNVGDTTPTGKYNPRGDSPYGCSDMAGNVWEWTSSLMKPYPYVADDGRENPDSPNARVLRGGAYTNYRRLVSCPNRYWSLPNARHNLFGFRVCLTVTPQEQEKKD